MATIGSRLEYIFIFLVETEQMEQMEEIEKLKTQKIMLDEQMFVCYNLYTETCCFYMEVIYAH